MMPEKEGTEVNKKYQALFHEFNQRYFDSNLPHYRVRVVDYITKVGEKGRINRKSRLIRLAAGSEESETIATLVHEMAHAATNDRHASRFMAEMHRLLSSGAPITYERHIKGYEHTFTPKRLTRTFFRCTAEDAFIDAPTITLRAFVRWFIRDYGYADSSAEFIRKFPWASRIFSEIKKIARADEKGRAELLRK
jgi:hypothetical protein